MQVIVPHHSNTYVRHCDRDLGSLITRVLFRGTQGVCLRTARPAVESHIPLRAHPKAGLHLGIHLSLHLGNRRALPVARSCVEATTRPKRPRKPKPINPTPISENPTSSDSEENDDGPCAKLTDCVDPGGINWICCDHCSRWFHCACVGLRTVFYI